MILAHQMDRWEMILFFGGFLLAELRSRQEAHAALKVFSSTGMHQDPGRVWSALYILSFLSGIYLGGQPNRHVEHAPGWATLYSWIPKHVHERHRYWPTFGGLLIVWSTSNHPSLQKIFSNSFSQYLGKLSYALYLVHGAVIHTLGYSAMDFFWRVFGRDTTFQIEAGFVLASGCVIVTTVCVADLFMRLVDTPTVKFARMLEDRMLLKLKPSEPGERRDSAKIV
jgi:peptidoglycan/LPS O-acetylase OafA/YrhL